MDAHEVSSDVFETLVVRAEGILNLRPLTAASTSPDDFKPLTPNDIPHPGMLLTLPLEILPPATEPTPSILLKCWQQVCALADGYWRRRQREYISLLQSCVKWMRERPNIKVSDLVLVVESTLRHEWPLAPVTEVFYDVKGHVRRIMLTNARRCVFEQHVTGVVPLEVIDTDKNDNDNDK